MYLRRAIRVLTGCNQNLWRSNPLQVKLCTPTSHAGIHSGAGLGISACRPFRSSLRARQNVFSSPSVWHRYLSSSVGQKGEGDQNWYDIDTPEFVQIVEEQKAGEDRLIVDVREPEELMECGMIPSTVNIPRK